MKAIKPGDEGWLLIDFEVKPKALLFLVILFLLSHLFSLKVLGSKGVSLTLGNQGSEADWPYQGAIEAAKVNFAGDNFLVSYSCRALEPTWS